jgi:predicted SAM-dependent methyltransferase
MALIDSLKFEVKSFVGRLLSSQNRSPKANLVHIDCGTNLFEGFENLDFFQLKFWKVKHVQHDLRYRLPYKDSTFEGAFSEHVLEHFCFEDAKLLLTEIYRVLGNGGFFRCAVPDLNLYVQNYVEKPVDKEFEKFSSGCEAFNHLTQMWGHLSVWDEQALKKEMKAVGFDKVEVFGFGEGNDNRLIRDSESRRWETIYIEGVKNI